MEVQLNGKRLLITPASFEDAMELQDAVGESLKGTKLDFKGLTGLGTGNGADILGADISELAGPLETILGMGLSVITSKRVKAALFKCAEKAIYGDAKVDRDFFENVDNRELYYPIMMEIVKVNLGPFFKKVSSLFTGPGNLFQKFLQSKSN